MEGSLSTRYTVCPCSARSNAAAIPATPAPITRTLLKADDSFISLTINLVLNENFHKKEIEPN